jgi:hypothetical protein
VCGAAHPDRNVRAGGIDAKIMNCAIGGSDPNRAEWAVTALSDAMPMDAPNAHSEDDVTFDSTATVNLLQMVGTGAWGRAESEDAPTEVGCRPHQDGEDQAATGDTVAAARL